MIIWQVSSLGHRFIDSRTRFETLEDFNTEFASAFYPSFSRYCVLKINIRATNSRQAWRNLWISNGPMNFGNNSGSGTRSGIPGLYVTSAKSMEYDRGSGAPSGMPGLSVTLAKSKEYDSGSGAYFGMLRWTTASFKSSSRLWNLKSSRDEQWMGIKKDLRNSLVRVHIGCITTLYCSLYPLYSFIMTVMSMFILALTPLLHHKRSYILWTSKNICTETTLKLVSSCAWAQQHTFTKSIWTGSRRR